MYCKLKRGISVILTLLCLMALLPRQIVHASVRTQFPEDNCFLRIRCADSNHYLDVPYGHFDNGQQLQIWEKAYGNQNQIFIAQNSDDGWLLKPLCCDSSKIVEVRDSSTDNWAQVAIWDAHSLPTAHWHFIPGDNGTVKIQNANSGLYLNRCFGGDPYNGQYIIQYEEDNTGANAFFLEVLNSEDVLSAVYCETEGSLKGQMSWTRKRFGDSIDNRTGFELSGFGQTFYPKPGQRVFASAEFLSPATVGKMLRDKAYAPAFRKQIWDVLQGEGSEEAIAHLLKAAGLDNVPVVGIALGVLNTLAHQDEYELWNRFVDAAKIDAQGGCSGVIVYTYYDFVRSNRSGDSFPVLERVIHTEYATWNGSDFGNFCDLPEARDGRWKYTFK